MNRNVFSISYVVLWGAINSALFVFVIFPIHRETAAFFYLGWLLGQFVIPVICFVFGAAPFFRKLVAYLCAAYYLLYSIMLPASDFGSLNLSDVLLVSLLIFPMVLLPTFPVWLWQYFSGWRIETQINAHRQSRQFTLQGLIILTAIVAIVIGILRWWYLSIDQTQFLWSLQLYIYGGIMAIATISSAFMFTAIAILLRRQPTTKSIASVGGLMFHGVAFTFLLVWLLFQSEPAETVRPIFAFFVGQLITMIINVPIACRCGITLERCPKKERDPWKTKNESCLYALKTPTEAKWPKPSREFTEANK